MFRSLLTVGLVSCSALALPQFHGDPSLAKILQEQRFDAGEGKFGSAFAQEDGVVFREESSGNNNRIGQYSYIGDDGKTYTVKYEAGINGFRILDGAHIPSGGQTSAQAALNDAGEPEEYDYEYYDETKPESPFVNPYDPTHNQQFLLAGDLAGHLAQRTFTTTPKPLPGLPTVEPVHRFFPPGEIKLQRSSVGYNFQFQSQK